MPNHTRQWEHAGPGRSAVVVTPHDTNPIKDGGDSGVPSLGLLVMPDGNGSSVFVATMADGTDVTFPIGPDSGSGTSGLDWYPVAVTHIKSTGTTVGVSITAVFP